MFGVQRNNLSDFMSKDCLADGGLVGDNVTVRIAVPRAKDRIGFFFVGRLVT